jgi:hypothetical protein
LTEERENTREVKFESFTYGDKEWWFDVWDIVYNLCHDGYRNCEHGTFKITIEFHPEDEVEDE